VGFGSGADHWITLTNIKHGSLVREFQADVVGPSGLVQDGNTMWITSTHNSIIVHCDLNGKTNRQICHARRGPHL
jgi:hypothetical protein